jgi:thiol-disulfide isomerase/thioredoxin
MARYLNVAVCLAAILLSPCAYASDAQRPYTKDPEAIAIMQRGDSAIRKLKGLSFKADYVGSFTARGRVRADVLVRRDVGNDDVMGTVSYRTRTDISAIEAPYVDHLPEHYTLLDGPTGATLIDWDERVVRLATGADRPTLNAGAISSVILPQYLRPEPLTMEIEDSIGAAYLGTQKVHGVDTDVVWLKFEDASGYGEQLLYFGVDDHLLRRATLTSPRVVISAASTSSPEATFPTMHFDLTLSELTVLPSIPDKKFSVSTDGFQQIRLSPPAVGQASPEWTLPTGAGDTVSSSDVEGQVTYLYFWASWCPICHVYLPEVQKIHDDFKDVQVLAINAYDRDDALRYVQDLNYTFDVALRGDDLLGNEFQFVGLPALVIIDRNGVIRHRELVPSVDEADEIRSLIRSLVDEG